MTSEDQTQEKNYKITVTKTPDAKIANTNLEILAIENALLNPVFSNDVTQYQTQISNEITKLNIFAVPENEQGKVDILGNDNLKEGNNEIKVIVTAANGITKREYKISAYKRNLIEEEEFKKIQEENNKKLEEAYEIEKTISESEKNLDETQKDNKNYIVLICGVIATAIILTIIGIVYYKKRLKNKN